MTKPLIPTRNSKGQLLCPRCMSALVDTKAPYYMAREYLGDFDSKYCNICQYSLLTASGYDAAVREARKYGFVGPEEELVSKQEVIEEKPDTANVQYDWQTMDKTNTIDDKVPVSNIYEPKIQGHSNSSESKLLISETKVSRHLIKKQKIIIQTQ